MPSRLRRLTALLCMLLGAVGGALPAVADPAGPVAVAGADGRTGRLVVRELLAAGYPVRALVRDPADGGFAEGVDVVQADAREPSALGPALAGATAHVIAIGARPGDAASGPEQVDYRGVQNLASAAAAAQLGHVVLVSSAGVTRDDHPLNRRFDDVLQWKARGEAALRASGVPWTIIRPGGLTDADTGAGGVRLVQGDAGTGFIPRADVARIAVAALGEPSARGRTFEAYAAGGPPPADWAKTFNALAVDAAGTPGDSKP
jgi:uncharacterized protein YbjT (DUF2867 family)